MPTCPSPHLPLAPPFSRTTPGTFSPRKHPIGRNTPTPKEHSVLGSLHTLGTTSVPREPGPQGLFLITPPYVYCKGDTCCHLPPEALLARQEHQTQGQSSSGSGVDDRIVVWRLLHKPAEVLISGPCYGLGIRKTFFNNHSGSSSKITFSDDSTGHFATPE